MNVVYISSLYLFIAEQISIAGTYQFPYIFPSRGTIFVDFKLLKIQVADKINVFQKNHIKSEPTESLAIFLPSNFGEPF
jgi:hypothetical protein